MSVSPTGMKLVTWPNRGKHYQIDQSDLRAIRLTQSMIYVPSDQYDARA